MWWYHFSYSSVLFGEEEESFHLSNRVKIVFNCFRGKKQSISRGTTGQRSDGEQSDFIGPQQKPALSSLCCPLAMIFIPLSEFCKLAYSYKDLRAFAQSFPQVFGKNSPHDS